MAENGLKNNKIVRSLLFWVLLAILFGILLGGVMPNGVIKVFATFNDIFSQFLQFCVPLIIVGLVAPALSDLGRGAGKWLLVTVGIAYGSTLFAGYGTLAVDKAILPGLLANEALKKVGSPENAVGSALDSIDAEGNAIKLFELVPILGVMPALVLAFIVGIGVSLLRSNMLHSVLGEFREIIMGLIKYAIVPLLPVYIFGTFMNMAKSGQIASVISAMVKVILVSVLLTVVLLLIQYLIAGAIAKVNPFKALAHMMSAYVTALGTSSSAATIPVTYKCALSNGVSSDIAGFVIPLCATIHLAGSTVKITTFAFAIIIMTGMDAPLGSLLAFVALLGVIMVAAPGVPGGAIAAAQGVLVGLLGFNADQYALMVALYVAIDSIGTATNVTGDGAIALVINKLAGGSLGKEKALATATADEMVDATD
ncbi:MAG: dicarboxylate/amino acid:cation symporter [Varibaculum sp.]|nr:dicarboxylate/amino acid:cation symporter [Varibaculum sp.]